MTKIKTHLENTLTFKEYSNLNTKLKCTETKLSRLISGTDYFEKQHIKILCEMLLIAPAELIEKYDLKTNISINDFNSLQNDYTKKKKIA
jgi:hypothetical protein